MLFNTIGLFLRCKEKTKEVAGWAALLYQLEGLKIFSCGVTRCIF